MDIAEIKRYLSKLPKNKKGINQEKYLNKLGLPNSNSIIDAQFIKELEKMGYVKRMMSTEGTLIYITDKGLDVDKNENNEEYTLRKIIENDGSLNVNLIDGTKFKTGNSLREVLQRLVRDNKIYKDDFGLGNTYRLTKEYEDSLHEYYYQEFIKHFNKLEDGITYSWESALEGIEIPEMFLYDVRKRAEMEDMIVITHRTQQGNLFKKGEGMKRYYLQTRNIPNSNLKPEEKLAQTITLIAPPNNQQMENIKENSLTKFINKHSDLTWFILSSFVGGAFYLGTLFGNKSFDNEKKVLFEEKLQLMKDTTALNVNRRNDSILIKDLKFQIDTLKPYINKK